MPHTVTELRRGVQPVWGVSKGQRRTWGPGLGLLMPSPAPLDASRNQKLKVFSQGTQLASCREKSRQMATGRSPELEQNL